MCWRLFTFSERFAISCTRNGEYISVKEACIRSKKNTLIFVWIWMWCKYCCLRIDRLYIKFVKLCILITKINRYLISVHRMCTTYYSVTGTFPVSLYSGITCEQAVLMWLIQMQRTPVVDSRKISLVTHFHPPISRRLLSTADWSHHPRIK